MTNRARLILNPVAGRDSATDYVERLNARLRRSYPSLEIVLTAHDGDAETAARRAVEDGCTDLFVGGGDGTLNEALNGVASVRGALGRVTFGVIPLGTGNDFAHGLGLPADVDEAVSVLLEGRTVLTDLGRLNGRAFVNVSGGGFIAEASRAVTPQLKSVAGRLAYLLGGSQALLEFEPFRATVTAEPDGERLGCGLSTFAVCNSRLIGGGRLIAPHALVDDGLLDLCLIEAMTALEFVALLRQVADGGHLDDPRVRYLRASRLELSFDRAVPVNTDGEVLMASRCEYRVEPRAVRFFSAGARFSVGGQPADTGFAGKA